MDSSGVVRFKIKVEHGSEIFFEEGFKSKIISNDGTIYGNYYGTYGFYSNKPKQ